MKLFSHSSASLCDLVEEAFTNVAAERIDRENAVIRGVKILGRKSAHGYEYSDRAIQEAASLYDGVDVNIEHPESNYDRIRPIAEGWGALRNIQVQGDGVYGDLHYLKEHAATPVLLERISRGFPIGLSHNAKGTDVSRSGKRIIESVKRVNSVDIVRRGATTKTLFESEGAVMKTTVSAAVAKAKDQAPEWVAVLESLDGATEIEVPSGGDELIESVAAAVRQAVGVSLVEGSFSTAQANVAKLFGLAVPTPNNNNQPDGNNADAAIVESINAIKAELAAVRHESAVNRVLESHGLTRAALGVERVKLLESQPNESAMSALVESWPPAVRGLARPVAKIAGGSYATAPKTAAEIDAILRGR